MKIHHPVLHVPPWGGYSGGRSPMLRRYLSAKALPCSRRPGSTPSRSKWAHRMTSIARRRSSAASISSCSSEVRSVSLTRGIVRVCHRSATGLKRLYGRREFFCGDGLRQHLPQRLHVGRVAGCRAYSERYIYPKSRGAGEDLTSPAPCSSSTARYGGSGDRSPELPLPIPGEPGHLRHPRSDHSGQVRRKGLAARMPTT